MKPFDITHWANLIASLRGVPIVRLVDQHRDGLTNVVALRHDVDADIKASVEMARLEAAHGIRSTYFILNTADYFEDRHGTLTAIEAILHYGHEIGWHNNAITQHILTGRPTREIIDDALAFLRQPGAPVVGTASHGDGLCYEYHYTNYHLWSSCPKPTDRSVYDLAEFGLEYEAYFLPRMNMISESGGIWQQDNASVINAFREKGGVLQVLTHPQWWQI